MCSNALKPGNTLTKQQILDCLWRRGLAYYQQDRFALAAEDFHAIWQQSADDVDAALMLAKCKLNLDADDEEMAVLRQIVSKHRCARAYSMIAAAHVRKSQFAEAEDSLLKALEIDPDEPHRFLVKAQMAGLAVENSLALVNTSECLKHCAGRSGKSYLDVSSAAYFKRAQVNFLLGNYSEAMRDAVRVRDYRSDPVVGMIRAEIYISEGRMDAAKEAAAVKNRASDNPAVAERLKVLRLLLNGEAATILRKCESREFDETKPSIYSLVAAALVLENQPRIAAGLLSKVSGEEFRLDSAPIWALIVTTCLDTDQCVKDGLTCAERLSHMYADSNPRYLLILSLAQAANGKFEEAEKSAKAAIDRMPKDAPVRAEYEKILKLHKEKKRYRFDPKSEFALSLLL